MSQNRPLVPINLSKRKATKNISKAHFMISTRPFEEATKKLTETDFVVSTEPFVVKATKSLT